MTFFKRDPYSINYVPTSSIIIYCVFLFCIISYIILGVFLEKIYYVFFMLLIAGSNYIIDTQSNILRNYRRTIDRLFKLLEENVNNHKDPK